MGELAHSKLRFLSVFCNQSAYRHFMLCPKNVKLKVGCDTTSQWTSFNFRIYDKLHLMQMLICS